ncbi:MAG TPA: TetR/AcrR family transcriptional regulator C-terminal domain-containing protein [Candidatus Limnocylindrales bacterium]
MSDYVPGLVWTRTRRPRGARPSLDRATIVRGAVELLDAHGLAGLSMRQLGSHLNCGATTLYWHVANKEELLDLTFDEVMGELSGPEPGLGWREQIIGLLSALRAMMLRHPWYVRVYGSRPGFGPHALRFNAGLISVLRAAGFSGERLDNAQAALGQYVLGAVTNELSWQAWRSMPREQIDTMLAYIREAIQQYPDYEAYLQEYLLVTDPEKMMLSRFTTALESLLDGLANRRDTDLNL